MADDFFMKAAESIMEGQEETTTTEPQTFKVGEKEYSQEELSRLVGLGEIGAEAEEKYGVRIDKIWPNHQRTINEKMELENRIKSLETAPKTAPSSQELDDQAIAKQAREKLAELGYVGREEVQRMVNDTVAGLRLTEHAQSIIDDMAEQGYPKTNLEELLTFMSDPANPKDPKKAYKAMFEDEIDRVKESKLATLKPSAFVTTSSSTAGSKEPAPQKVTSKNLKDALMAVLPD
jgi:Ca2+-binding EF-hand superfamily protein